MAHVLELINRNSNKIVTLPSRQIFREFLSAAPLEGKKEKREKRSVFDSFILNIHCQATLTKPTLIHAELRSIDALHIVYNSCINILHLVVLSGPHG